MAIPDYQSLMLPVLQTLADRDEVSIAETHEQVAARLKLSDEDLAERPPRGRQSTFINRTSWAVAYLSMAGLVDNPRRGVYRVTKDGEGSLASSPNRIDNKLLDSYPAFVMRRSSPDRSFCRRATIKSRARLRWQRSQALLELDKSTPMSSEKSLSESIWISTPLSMNASTFRCLLLFS